MQSNERRMRGEGGGGGLKGADTAGVVEAESKED